MKAGNQTRILLYEVVQAQIVQQCVDELHVLVGLASHGDALVVPEQAHVAVGLHNGPGSRDNASPVDHGIFQEKKDSLFSNGPFVYQVINLIYLN